MARLKKYDIAGLVVAFVLGAAATDFVKSIVNDTILTLLAPVLPRET